MTIGDTQALPSATLAVIGTPIGNLGDMSARAIEVLKSVDVLCCEDKRRTGILLGHIGVRVPMMLVANEHTEVGVVDDVLGRLGRGQRIGFVADAGMPTVSDPGSRMVSAVHDAGFNVTVIPGPAAVTSALAVSGLRAERFMFEGFLPRKGSSRKQRMNDIGASTVTSVLYEAPHRVRRTLSDLSDVCGADRTVVVVKELTKRYETVLKTSLAEAVDHFEHTEPRGEFVLVVDGNTGGNAPVTDETIIGLVADAVGEGTSLSDSVRLVASELGVPRRRVYKLALDSNVGRS